MSELTRFRSDFTVKLNVGACCGGDEEVAFAAWAIPPIDHDAWDWKKDLDENHGKDGSDSGIARVIGACLKGRHNSPFEHGLMSLYIEAPGVVWWQLTRQRFMSLDAEDLSFSLESGRYKHLDPEFYLPPPERPCREVEGFKPMRPTFESDELASSCVRNNYSYIADECYRRYGLMVGMGVARELARNVLPNWMLYCDGYVTAKPLSWLQFFSKRNRTSDTTVATFPQWEIEQVASECERLFAEQWPIVHAAFVSNGRQCP